MIRHTKSAAVPSSLGRGVQANEDNCTAYDTAAADYRSGARSFDIRKGIYGTDVVKRQLKADQHDKCAFCEAIFDANVAGDVEHYRPKGAVDTDAGRIYPGIIGWATHGKTSATPVRTAIPIESATGFP